MELNLFNMIARRTRTWLGVLAASSIALAATSASAQVGNQYPTLQGTNSRVGHNDQPLTTGPGRGRVNWFTPAGPGSTTTVTVDNTDFANTGGFPNGPFQVNPNGNAIALNSANNPAAYDPNNIDPTASWARALSPAEEARGPYLVNRFDRPSVLDPRATEERVPSYAFTRTTASASGQAATVAANPQDRRAFEWQLKGPMGASRNYAIYTWLQVGATTINGQQVFPQQYHVYEIELSDGRKIIDVVDTYAAGTGFVRLGGGGRPTNAVFPFDGITPIRVRLYNTVPRDASGNLLLPEGKGPNDAKNYLVYADAIRFIPEPGTYAATPTIAEVGTNDYRVVAALNSYQGTFQNGQYVTNTRGVVTSYRHNLTNVNSPGSNVVWNYTPFDDNNGEGERDNESADVTAAPGWTRVFSAPFVNGDYRQNNATTDPASVTGVTYAPTLPDGDYDVFVYLAGNEGSSSYATQVRYEIREGSTVSEVTVDQSQRRGWVRIGNRKFANTVTTGPGEALSLRITNFTTSAADAGKPVYADAVRFVNSGNLAVNSTPVQARARILLPDKVTIEERSVVIVADESGRIHCLDATGRGDGTTTEYWVYPSRRVPGQVDPNLQAGIDGPNTPEQPATPDSVPVAEMPSGFDLSTAIVQRIGTKDYLYIASTNGRIYCLDMTGRGDFNETSRAPGTTERLWSYPNDFPHPVPQRSNLGPFRSSLVYATTGSDQTPTIFAASVTGRVYALNALPTNTTQRTTGVRWTFPQLNEPTVGAIVATPSYDFNRLYFGTLRKDDQPGRFYSLDGDTGAQRWVFPSDAQTAETNSDATLREMGDFTASPATVADTLIGGGMPNTVFVLNQNGYVYALNALGDLSSPDPANPTLTPIWATNEIGSGSQASLTYTGMNVLDSSGGLGATAVPTILVPTSDGRIVGLYARQTETNRASTRRNYEATTFGSSFVASVSVANGFMYAADVDGNLVAYSDTATAFDPGVWGRGPDEGQIVENDPRGDRFREAKVGLIRRQTYQGLRLPTGSAGHFSYNAVIDESPTKDPDTNLPRHPIEAAHTSPRSSLAFEWGETVYLLVYDFPYDFVNSAGQNVPPPVVNISFNVGGQTVRSIPVEARLFSEPPLAPDNSYDNTRRNNGYAILAYTFQGGGPNALPPGNAEISVSISARTLNSQGASQNVSLDPRLSRKPFFLANPLGIAIINPVGGAQSIGFTADPGNEQNRVNGSPDVVGTSAIESRLLATAGMGNHGQTNKTRVLIYDRSMMSLIRPDGRGLDNVRVTRSELAWQGGANTVFKPLSPALYPGFEDLPINLPNTSLDYPDIRREGVRVTKDPNGAAENPLFNGVFLRPPTKKGSTEQIDELTDPTDRDLHPTVFELAVDVPRFQPPNVLTAASTGIGTGTGRAPSANPQLKQTDANGNVQLQGYLGRLSVFVDSTQNGRLDVGSREAYRAFNLATAVAPDQKLRVVTPTVDPASNTPALNVGSLAAGTGYTPDGSTVPFGPRLSSYQGLFKQFGVLNEGNVNMLDVRMAKSTNVNSQNASAIFPWAFGSGANDPQAWLDGTMDLWSNFDVNFAPAYGPGSLTNRQIIQKPRVGDTVPTELVVNPATRENPGLNEAGDRRLIPGLAEETPKVAVSIPIGFPVGRYTERVSVIENENGTSNEIWQRFDANTVETHTDPGFLLTFNVAETRLTNALTPGTAPMVEDLLKGVQPKFTYQNLQPAGLRDQFGSLVMAWTSNRPTAVPATGFPTQSNLNTNYRLYLASLDNAASFGTGTITPPSAPANEINRLAGNNQDGVPLGASPLSDLNFFTPASSSSWFKFSGDAANGFPSAALDNALFGVQSGESLLDGTIRYSRPAFPLNGAIDPLRAPSTARTAAANRFGSIYMAFVGDAEKQTPTGRTAESRLLISSVATNETGQVSIGQPVALAQDVTTVKGKPTLVQTKAAPGAMVFYPGTSTGSTGIYYTRFDGTKFTPPSPMPFGDGFESVSSPSAAARYYRNFVGSASDTYPIIELTFTGKLRGRPSAEVYTGRVTIDQQTRSRLPENPDGTLKGNPFVNQPERALERLVLGENGVYRARGVYWDRTRPIALIQRQNNVDTNLLLDGSDGGADTRVYDRESGLISFETRLGGRVTFDPALGTVRFTNAAPSRNAELRLTYTPVFVRISEGGANGYSGATGLFDDRTISDPSYWRRATGTPANHTDTGIRHDRFVYMYGRGAGAGVGARPYMTTMRLGIRLPTPIATNSDGSVINVRLSGHVGQYQLDPANGRIYFTAVDEDRPVTVRYTGVNVGTGQPIAGITTQPMTVSLVLEKEEQPVLIEQAINESNLATFIDPFDVATNNLFARRPPLTWLFWTSNRAGGSDLYFQTIAPRLTPLAVGR
jgi:hypothetical protein